MEWLCVIQSEFRGGPQKRIIQLIKAIHDDNQQSARVHPEWMSALNSMGEIQVQFVTIFIINANEREREAGRGGGGGERRKQVFKFTSSLTF